MQTLVGIYLNEQHRVEDLFRTLYNLALFGGVPHRVVLLGDNLSPALATRVNALSHLTLIDEAGGRGRPFFFNALTGLEADIYCLLDAGVVLTEGCLPGLVGLLASSPGNGLASPTLNNCWHVQGMYTDRQPEAVAASARADELRVRFGEQTAELAPLYGIGEAMLLVTGAAVRAVGPADIRYGRGYCWEMDYVARAVLAGFRALWGKGFYAHQTAVAAGEERQRTFARDKRYYQRKFCLRHLRDEGVSYCEHCRGGDCPEFAPVALPAADGVAADGGPPLISCIMPTRGRPEYVRQALCYFARQDYPVKELLVIYEKETDLPHSMQDMPRVRLVKSPVGASIGEKRNRGCEQACGEIIAQWDDDDWYAPDRLTRQARPLIAGLSEISGLYNAGYYEVEGGRYWRCSPELFERMFVGGVFGGTLVYRRAIWGGEVRYPDTSLREDADFLVLARRHGARLLRTDGDGIYLYIRHGRNSWQFAAGDFLDPAGWMQLPTPNFLGEDLSFYRDRQGRPVEIRTGNPLAVGRRPRVSCIMPTGDRPEMVQRALALYRDQDYPDKELIVVDDGLDKVDYLCGGEGIVYLPMGRRISIGAKRNLACEQARGEIIVHLDDDDWYAGDWLTRQVEHLSATQAEVTGLAELLFYDSVRGEAWQYRYPAAGRLWVHGATLCYRKEFWRRSPFPDIDVGEDCSFLWRPGKPGIVAHDAIDGYLGHIHGANVSLKQTGDACWTKIDDPSLLRRCREAIPVPAAMVWPVHAGERRLARGERFF
ncbi:MAG: glycosyltransferase [Desulfobulbaceae bacterium]|nr:glycosyltransferase [Desulfobulbaceae bacterium]